MSNSCCLTTSLSFTYLHSWKNTIMSGQHLFLPRKVSSPDSFITANKALKQDKSKPNSWPISAVTIPFNIYKFFFTPCFRKYSFLQQWSPLKTSYSWINKKAKLGCSITGKNQKSSLSVLLLTQRFTMAFRQFDMVETHKGRAKIVLHFLVFLYSLAL